MNRTRVVKMNSIRLNGELCPRCGNPTEIREHDRIGEKQLRQPFYYSRWFNCVNRFCKTTLIMPDKYRVWNKKHGVSIEQAKRVSAITKQLSFTDADIGDYDGEPPF